MDVDTPKAERKSDAPKPDRKSDAPKPETPGPSAPPPAPAPLATTPVHVTVVSSHTSQAKTPETPTPAQQHGVPGLKGVSWIWCVIGGIFIFLLAAAGILTILITTGVLNKDDVINKTQGVQKGITQGISDAKDKV